MSNSSPKMIINQLVLVGRQKSYYVSFNKGLNIIYGDSDTGKSSILNIIDYMLGGKKVDLYDEIEKHGKYALLELEINNVTFTIKRDIFDATKYIEVYKSEIDSMDDVFPKEYGPNFSIQGSAGFYSDFLLSQLNIPLIKIKESPSKQDSKMARLSFRDIFKYCFFNQDEVGSKEILDRKSYSLITKNKETFKFLHNVLDTQITELQNEIAEKAKDKNKKKNEYSVISTFFRETNISTESSLTSEKNNLLKDIEIINSEIEVLNTNMIADSNIDNELREQILSLEKLVSKLNENKIFKERQLEQNIRLKAEYEKDIDKLKISINTKKRLSSLKFEHVDCPICNNSLSIDGANEYFNDHSDLLLKKELNSIQNKVKELKKLISDTRIDLANLEVDINEHYDILKDLKNLLDENANNFISPFISQRDIIISRKSQLHEELERINYLLKLRNQLDNINKEIELLNQQITELNIKLDNLKATAPTVNSVLDNLGNYLKEFLEFIPIKNPYGISISDKTYLPIVRDRDYTELTSGGLRTLVSVGYIVSLLKNSLNSSTQYPSLVMIDTIGKYLGKTKKDDATSEENNNLNEALDDPTKYKRIYKYLHEFSSKALEENKDHQIIIVDNDFPEELETNYNKYVIKKFSVESKEGFEIGFINNA
ncbi:MAG: hypothetical protein ABS951_16745 [Solibacillus sp.]